jgi:hypothetical protein
MMMKKLLLLTLSLCLVSGFAGAAETLLDGCEDTSYTTVAASGESITLATSTTASEGTYSLEVTYDYLAGAAWTKNSQVTKTFATPVDLSDM